MEFLVKKELIESILINLQPFLEKKDVTQITSHIYFEIDDISTIKATDTEIGLLVNTKELDIKEKGSFTVNGKRVLDIVRILKDEEIRFKLKGETLYISQSHSNFKLPIFNPTDFPEFPTVEGKPSISVDSLSLIKSFKKVASSIDTNNPKYELNGALVNIKGDRTDIVGTDTRRLSVVTIANSSDSELELIVPKKAILEIQKLFLNQIEMFYDDVILILRSPNMLFFTRLIGGKFPDYEKIIPQNPRHELTLPTKAMMDSIKMVSHISGEIRVKFSPNIITFNSLSSDNIEARTEIKLDIDIDEELEIYVNSRYLLDFLSQTNSTNFEMGINSSVLPFVVKNGNFVTVIMPIIV